ncbi:hypothetical protein CIRMBP1286_01940 [Enterococcus cecorum]|nr:hypothetical protein CIRMBP1286_01940 [Enterococcus cecorum]
MTYSKKNLLSEFPELKIINHPYNRLYLYRLYPKAIIPDIDRSPKMINIYKFFQWYDEGIDHNLEPDTFFASAHSTLRKIFKAFDNDFYVNNFKDFCIDRQVSYEGLSKSKAKQLRLEWFVEPTVVNKYIRIISHEDI